MQRYLREHFWNAIIWPLLWPLLLIQAALVLMCLLVGALIWWMSPAYSSWSTTLWLAVALLLGSSLNVGAFLMLVKARARHKDTRFMYEIFELEQQSQALYATAGRVLTVDKCTLPETIDEPHLPLQQLASVNALLAGLERCIRSSQVANDVSKSTQQEHEQSLLDDIRRQQIQLKHLTVGRDRAREESRLKSGYLTLLQSETDSLDEYLNALADNGASAKYRQDILRVSERLSDIRSLLSNLVQQSAGPEGEHQLEENNASLRSLRVLVVDDGPVNLMLARQMLETQGLHVEAVSSGEQALERQQNSVYDLVFMDIFMPTLDGLETTRRWREYERTHGGKRSVLVALTANVDNAGRDACLAVGMDDLLSKPYQPETLLNIITHWFPGTIKVAPLV